MLKFGIVSEVKPGFVRVSLQGEDEGFVTKWIPVIVDKSLTDKTSYPLEAKEHVACMMDEQLEDGVVLGAIYSEADKPDTDEAPGKFRKKFSDGTVIEYNKNTHKLTADVKGSIEAKATISAKVVAPLITLQGNVTVTGILAVGSITAASAGSPVAVTGDFAISGDMNATGDVKSGLISLKTHKHGGVQTGPGVTLVPQP